MRSPEWTAWNNERLRLKAKWESAKRAWDRDGGPLENTINRGEDLYFAADELIEHLGEEPAWEAA